MAKASANSPPVQVGSITFSPGVPPQNALPQFVPPVSHLLVGPSVNGVKELLNHLRTVRDQKVYLSEAHSFREWCMNNFGERMGGWVEEML